MIKMLENVEAYPTMNYLKMKYEEKQKRKDFSIQITASISKDFEHVYDLYNREVKPNTNTLYIVNSNENQLLYRWIAGKFIRIC